MTEQELVEKVAEAIWLAEAARANRRRYILWADVGDTMRDNYRPLARAALSVIREALREPSEAQWNGLARDLIMWHDMGNKTPRALFDHLTMLRREIPDWLRNEPEMQALDHVPSKGTRAALIYRAMIAASPIGEK